MKTRSPYSLLAVLVGVLFFGAMAYGVLQAPPAPAPVPWTVNDNQNETDLIDRSAKKTTTDFTVTNNGDDHSIHVRIRNKQGGPVGEKTLENPDSYSGTIPKGGKVTIEDENDSPDTDGATGTYTTS